jgi:endonuclease G
MKTIIIFILGWTSQLQCDFANKYLPQSSYHIKREGYELLYDGRTRNAIWVYEILSSKDLQSKAVPRRGFSFKQDPGVPEFLRTKPSDYKNTSFDKGHLCPFADCRTSLPDAANTFFLTNASPQHPEFNRGAWSQLERHIRNLAANFDCVHVLTMPLFLPKGEKGAEIVEYRILGAAKVAVPTHFCKIVFAEKENALKEVFVYLLPNEPIQKNRNLETFRTTLSEIEMSGGFFFPAIPAEYKLK